MLAVPLPSRMLAPLALLSFRPKVSVETSAGSGSTVTITCWLVTPGAKVSVPWVAV